VGDREFATMTLADAGKGFFDEFPAFLATSQTSAVPERLNARHAAIIGHNPAAFAGKRVLDIASHDGRWSFAALKAGAAHVTGIEPRAELIDNAKGSMARYGVRQEEYEFRQGDVFTTLATSGLRFDTVLCLGFFYHTIRHSELVHLMERTGARDLIIDTEVALPAVTAGVVAIADTRRVFGVSCDIQLLKDPVQDESMAWPDALTRNGYTLVGRPTNAALRFILDHFGFSIEEFDWPSFLRGLPPTLVASTLSDYAEGWRGTFHCRRR